jgi:hypothetical protein
MQTTDNTPLIQAFDADFRNAHPGGHWYNIDIETCEADARFFEARRDQREESEYRIAQHSAGFAANIRGAEFDHRQPTAWIAGWLDAQELGELAPLVWLRQEAEV